MMKHLAYISSLLILLLCSCSDDIQPDTPNTDVPNGTPIEIMASAEFPEMNFGPSSRAMGDQPTDDELLKKLKVNILVFDAAGVMMQFIPPSDISIVSIDKETKNVLFKVRNIYTSDQPRRMHFIVTSIPDIRKIEGGEYITAMANETTVMPALMSEGNTDVYWGLSEQANITSSMTVAMKVIRNFVKLSVTSSESTENFKLLGYTVVNRPNKGTIAPYIHETHKFASFITPENGLVSYDDIEAQGYHGVNPAGVETAMTHTSKKDVEESLKESENLIAANQDSPYYFYERSQSEIDKAGSDAVVTYLIVKGQYKVKGQDKGNVYYYKIDIGHNKLGKFEFFNLLRNFHYTVNITSVTGPGADSVEAAMKGMTHNNISASVATHDLFSISYNNEVIVVSDTQVIFTEKTSNYKLRFRYTMSNNTFGEAKYLKIYDMDVDDESKEYDMTGLTGGQPKTVVLAGEVIERASLSEERDAEGNLIWYVLNITTKDIPADARRFEQNLRVYYTDGSVNLGRSVTLMLRQPWHLSDVSNTKPTADAKSKFGISFKLPPGLISSQFPMTITFESDKQNIYAENGSDMTVATGKSSFNGATTDNVIIYEWNIPWTQYDSANGSTYTANFLTNTTSAEDYAYSTLGIDNAYPEIDGASDGNRTLNHDEYNFCIRIANKGQKYIEPYYVNIERPTS